MNTPPAETLLFADIELRPSERTVIRAGEEIPLTWKEFDLLEYFMRHPNEVVGREDLLNKLWGADYTGFSNVVDVHVKNLRKKLEGHGGGRILGTVRGAGYRLGR